MSFLRSRRFQAVIGVLALFVGGLFAVGPARVVQAADVTLASVISGGAYAATTSTAGFLSASDKAKLDGVQAGADDLADSTKVATTSAQGAMSALDKTAATAYVRGVITCNTLPPYAETGSAGSEVWTATSNGALPTSCTDGLTAQVNDRFLLAYNDTSTPDGGIVVVTATGSVGTPWVLQRSTSNGENTGARLAGMYIQAREGSEAGLWRVVPTSIVVGTTPFLARPVVTTNDKHGFRACSTFSEVSASRVVGTATGNQTVLDFYRGFLLQGAGAAAGLTNDTTGNGSLTTGTATGGVGQLATQFWNPTLARLEWRARAVFSVPTVSDGTNTFQFQLGLNNDANNFSRIAFNPTAGSAMTHVTTVASVAQASVQLCASCFSTASTYQYELYKPFGSSTVAISFDPGTGTLAYVGDAPATLPATSHFQVAVAKSAGTSARTTTLNYICAEVYDPFL